MKLETFFEKGDRITDAANVVMKMLESEDARDVYCAKGATSYSPALAGSAYPGSMLPDGFNLNGVPSFGQRRRTQPRWGWMAWDLVPRVAAAPQPWAVLRTPVGIRGTVMCPRRARGHGPGRLRNPLGLRGKAMWHHDDVVAEYSGFVRTILETQMKTAIIEAPGARAIPEAQRASVMEPRVRRTLGGHPSKTTNPNGVPSFIGGSWS